MHFRNPACYSYKKDNLELNGLSFLNQLYCFMKTKAIFLPGQLQIQVFVLFCGVVP